MIDEIARLNELIQKGRNGFENYRSIFEQMSEAYLMELNEIQKKELFERNKSALYFPKINAKAKRIMDSLSETYFSQDTFCVLQEYINSNPKVIEKWQKAIDFYTDQIKLYKIFQPEFLKISFIGTSIAKVYWGADNLGHIEILNIDDVFFDPDAVDFNDIRYVINKVYLTKSDIMEFKKAGVFKFNESEVFPEVDFEYERYELYDIYELNNGVWHLSTLYENNILREKTELKDGLPFVCGYMLPQVKKLDQNDYVAVYGEPNLASILSLQNATNNTANSMIDGMNQLIKPKLIVDKNAQISRLDIETIGKPVFTSNPSAVGVVPPPNITASFNALEFFERDMSDSTGISPQLNGVNTARKETATMASIMSNEGSTRLQGYIRTYNETFFEPIFERFAELVWKYGEALFFAGYSRKEMGSFKINLNTGIGALNKEVQKNSLIEAGTLLEKHMQICMSLQDINGAMRIKTAHKKLIEKLLPIYNIGEISEIFGDEKNEFIREYVAEPIQGGNIGEPAALPAPQGAGMADEMVNMQLQQNM